MSLTGGYAGNARSAAIRRGNLKMLMTVLRRAEVSDGYGTLVEVFGRGGSTVTLDSGATAVIPNPTGKPGLEPDYRCILRPIIRRPEEPTPAGLVLHMEDMELSYVKTCKLNGSDRVRIGGRDYALRAVYDNIEPAFTWKAYVSGIRT